jgi:hypothetical protein
LAQFFQRRGCGFQMQTWGVSSSPSDSTERVLNRYAAVFSVDRRCRSYIGRFATTLDLGLFQQNRPVTVAPPDGIRVRYRVNTGRALSWLARPSLTHCVISRLSIDAMQKDHSITVFALAAGLKGKPPSGGSLGGFCLELRPLRACWGRRGLGVRRSNVEH